MLRKTGDRWEFDSELALENFVWANLERLFGLTALKRQYNCNGEICDILAVDEESRLVVIELKNSEDRYIVQQLTRYYHNLLNEKPFESQVNYSYPVCLIAITPSFHRHNLIDRIYSKLKIQFSCFEILQLEQKFYFFLKDIDTSEDFKIEIPYQVVNTFDVSEDIPAAPQALLDYLGGYSKDKQQIILNLRRTILSFDQRIKEVTTAKSIQYGRGRTKLCAELYFDKKQCELVLFLWIPLWNYRKITIGRHRIWTDWTKVLYFGHVPEGLGKRMPREYWESIPREELPRKCYSMDDFIAEEFTKHIASSIGCKDDSGSLKSVVNLALEKWQARL